MSSFRPTFKPQTNWRQRELEREANRKASDRKAVEDADRKKYEKTETNFPTMLNATPTGPVAIGQNSFADLAGKWKNDSDVEKKLEEYRKVREERDRRELVNGVFVYRQHKTQRRRPSDEYEDYPDEDASAAPPPAPLKGVAMGMNLDESGWTEVSNKVHKTKRELSFAQMDVKYKESRDDRSHSSDDDVNGELFHSNRHDHDRV